MQEYNDINPGMPIQGVIDENKSRQAVKEILADLRDIAPALTTTDKVEVANICKLSNASEYLSANEIESQYRLVQKLRDKVMTSSEILTTNSARDLSALVTSLNSFISMYLRNQEKINHLQKLSNLREAVVDAIKDLGPDVTKKFYEKLSQFDE